MTPAQALVVIGLAFLLAAVFYEVGKKTEQKKFVEEIESFRRAVEADVHRISAEHIEEVRYAAYCQGVQDADNWWIITEEESEKKAA